MKVSLSERLEWYKAYRDSHTDYECIKDYWEKEIRKLERKMESRI